MLMPFLSGTTLGPKGRNDLRHRGPKGPRFLDGHPFRGLHPQHAAVEIHLFQGMPLHKFLNGILFPQQITGWPFKDDVAASLSDDTGKGPKVANESLEAFESACASSLDMLRYSQDAPGLGAGTQTPKCREGHQKGRHAFEFARFGQGQRAALWDVMSTASVKRISSTCGPA